MLEIKSSYSWACDCDRAGEKHGSSGASVINDSENGIFSLYVWKSCDEIHCDLLKGKGIFWGSDMVKRDSRLMSKVLILLACCTSIDIISDPGFHPFPL